MSKTGTSWWRGPCRAQRSEKGNGFAHAVALDHSREGSAGLRCADLRRCAISLGLAALVLTLEGCVTLNIPRTGEMVAKLGEGEMYRGTYRPARGASLHRDSAGSRENDAIPAWAKPIPAWAARHAILAELIGPKGRIECWFGLARPPIGVLGGGRGQCRMPDGSTNMAAFPVQI